MKILNLRVFILLLLPIVSSAQKVILVHPLSNADIIYGKVAQTKEIFYPAPKPGEKIDTTEKRLTWYDEQGNTQALERYQHTKTGWAANPNEFSIRLTKFGNPPVTTGKDSLEFRIMYDSLGHEVERDNYTADGKLSSKKLFYYDPDNTVKKSDMYSNGSLLYSVSYTYEKGRLVKEHIIFPNHTVYDVTYNYEGFDIFNNWIKQTSTFNAGTKNARALVTERRVIYYE